MNGKFLKGAALLVALLAVGVAGYWFGRDGQEIMKSLPGGDMVKSATASPVPATPAADGERKVLYWYDPMFPQHRFDQPGKSPFMDMQLVPKYAGDDDASGVRIDPVLAQNLGVRVVTVEKGKLASSVDAVASVTFNERDVTVIQARTGGFVERVYRLAPGDVVTKGAPIADVLVPEWTAAQSEFLALKEADDPSLTNAARERLKLLGMPSDLIDRVARTNKPHPVFTVTAPTGGVIQSLDVRAGMTVAPGMTLARVNGLSTVWLEAAVPETQAGSLKPGAVVEAKLPAFPGEVFEGKIAAVLPEASTETRTLRVRAEFPNPKGRLRPGLFAQMRILRDAAPETLVVPSEAVIRTGKRALVIVAAADNRFQPVEIDVGTEADGMTAVLSGVSAGQKVVVSGQFLIDSEASLKGVIGRMQATTSDGNAAKTAAALHEGEGKVTELSADEVTLSHGPIPSIQWGPMTMPFRLATPELAKGIKAGDSVKFGFRQTDDGFVVEKLQKVEAGK